MEQGVVNELTANSWHVFWWQNNPAVCWSVICPAGLCWTNCRSITLRLILNQGGKGIGRCLLRKMIAMAESENLSSILEVGTQPPPVPFMHLFGFLPVGGRRAYYADTGEDAVILLKKIGDN